MGTHDKRVKAVVAQVPSTLNPESRPTKDPEAWDRVGELMIEDRIQRYKTGSPNYMKMDWSPSLYRTVRCLDSPILCANQKAFDNQYFNALMPNKTFPASCEGFDHLISASETVRKPSLSFG